MELNFFECSKVRTDYKHPIGNNFTYFKYGLYESCINFTWVFVDSFKAKIKRISRDILFKNVKVDLLVCNNVIVNQHHGSFNV
jgi:glutathionyl-hydroquinone reductase